MKACSRLGYCWRVWGDNSGEAGRQAAGFQVKGLRGKGVTSWEYVRQLYKASTSKVSATRSGVCRRGCRARLRLPLTGGGAGAAVHQAAGGQRHKPVDGLAGRGGRERQSQQSA